MKRLLFMLLWLVLGFTGVSVAQQENFSVLAEEEIPYKLEMSFYDHFNKAQNVKWFKADEDFELYKAVYNTRRKSIAIVYKKNGEVLRQEISDKKNKIPAEVESYFAEHYKDYKLIQLSKVYVNAASEDVDYITYYQLKVKKDEKELALQFKEDHELFKGKNFIEAPAVL